MISSLHFRHAAISAALVFGAGAASAAGLTLNVANKQANSVQTFSTFAQGQFRQVGITFTALGNATAVTGVAGAYNLPITTISIGSNLKVASGAAVGSALKLDRVGEDEETGEEVAVSLVLANFKIDYTQNVVLADATPEQLAEAQSKIEGVRALVERGEMDFAAAAVRYSDSPNALEGGDLGWRSSDEIPNAFAEMVRRMAPGDVSAPLRGPSGFQLLKLVEVRDAAADAAANMVTQFQARHILVRVADASQDAAAKAKVDTLAARLAGGADFAQLAREESQDLTTQPSGGDLGWFAADAFGPQFGGQVAGLQDGQVSAPFRTEAGWHIVQRIGTRQVNATDQTRRAQISETIGRRKLEDEWNRFLRELRGEAFVDVRGQTDTPAAAPATGG